MAPLPVPMIAIQLFAEFLRAQNQARSIQASNDHHLALARLEASLHEQRLHAQTEISTLLITTARHVFDRKTDILMSSFSSVLDLLKSSHSSLLSERHSLSERLHSAKTKQDRLLCNQRLGDIDRRLSLLEHESRTLHADMLTYLDTLDIRGVALPTPIGSL